MNAFITPIRKIENKFKDHYYFTYTAIFAISALFVFASYWLAGRSLVWQGDGWSQHLKAMIFFARWMRSIVKELLFAHRLNIPTFSFSIGYGSDILTVLHYYVIGDPLTLFAVLVPTKYMPAFYSALVILRFYLSGIAFIIFCRYMEKKENPSSEFGKAAIFAGAIVYAFSGFALHGGIRHPYFMNPMIYFPLVTLGVEKILDGKSPVMFVLAVFVSAVSNFYFFYMIVLLTVLYVGWRLLSVYSFGQMIEGLRMLGKITLSAILGTGLSAIILLPEILTFFNSTRRESQLVYDFLYTWPEYAAQIGGFLSANNQHHWTIMGYAAVTLIAVILLFAQKERKDVKIAFIVLTLMTLLPPVGSMMNGFSYVAGRWVWGYSFFVAYILVLKWKKLFALTAKEKGVLLVSLSTYFLICVTMKRSCNPSVLFGCGMGFITLGAIYLAKNTYGTKCAQLIVIGCVLINVMGNAFFRYSPDQAGYSKQFLPFREFSAKLKNTEADVVEAASKKSNGFFRYSGTSITGNGTLISGLHSTQYAWSLENGNITKFRKEILLPAPLTDYVYRDLDCRTILSTLANVEYYVQPDNLPYGFVMLDLKKNADYKVWMNNYFLPFGYTYSDYILGENYEKMTPLEKQEALLQGCVIRSGRGAEAKLSFTGKQIDYEMDLGVNISVESNLITVKKNNAVMTLKFDGLAGSETYLYLTKFNFLGNPPAEEEQVCLSAFKEDKFRFYRKYYQGSHRFKLQLSAQNGAVENRGKTLDYQTPRFQWYNNREDFMVNFGYDKDAKKSITIQFPRAGKYSFGSIQVLCQPMTNYPAQIKALGENVLEDVNFHENAAFATQKVTGKINLNEAKYLLLTIPYSTGWSATVDGKKQDILKANTAWMALDLEPGTHEITLKYRTPGLTAGMIISGISLLLLMMFSFIGRRSFR